MTKILGYARVSTVGQDLETQIETLEKYGCDKIYHEKFTGTTTERPKFIEVINVLEEGDTLVITKLDRFARTTREATETIEMLFERGVKVHVLDLGGIIEDTPQGRLMFNIFSAFAEFERGLIVQRTQEGKAIARQRPDFKEGRPKKFSDTKLKESMEMREKMQWSMKKTAEMTGVSLSTLERYARKQRQ
ncbi:MULTISPECIES: recombinase family protein [unclassified Bacillus (in: firmicutes)]|uniref:recombinase family protein n=1 Tax=unclassified Bacillus (in: firmicutes) TaxID=185979 RepID=UPI0027DB6108|nr:MULTISPECIES: recombinase family protein [unclassified Bacillus (in: firmicutes)]